MRVPVRHPHFVLFPSFGPSIQIACTFLRHFSLFLLILPPPPFFFFFVASGTEDGPAGSFGFAYSTLFVMLALQSFYTPLGLCTMMLSFLALAGSVLVDLAKANTNV